MEWSLLSDRAWIRVRIAQGLYKTYRIDNLTPTPTIILHNVSELNLFLLCCFNCNSAASETDSMEDKVCMNDPEPPTDKSLLRIHCLAFSLLLH